MWKIQLSEEMKLNKLMWRTKGGNYGRELMFSSKNHMSLSGERETLKWLNHKTPNSERSSWSEEGGGNVN